MGERGKPLTKAQYLTEVRRDHPLAWGDGRVRTHRAVLYDTVGPGPHPCNWCGRALDWFSAPLICSDHLDGDTWNNEPSNLVVSCRACNSTRSNFMASECIHGHEFTEENTYYRKDATGQWPNRQCKKCSMERKRESYEPKRFGLHLAGLTMGELRRVVREATAVPDETAVFTYRESGGAA